MPLFLLGLFYSVHVLAATIWLASIILIPLYVLPSLCNTLGTGKDFSRFHGDYARYSFPLNLGCILILIVSGIFIYLQNSQIRPESWHITLAVKAGIFLLFVISYLIHIFSIGRKLKNVMKQENMEMEKLIYLRKKLKISYRINFVFSFMMIFISGFLAAQ
jgi:uncharacterized membrane protein